ncbi:hypothetical protein AK812_SmicGene45938 [Symbiodinium microadriaticum]|uniref:Uncharacterized protein n=1 Tax=Symbiodinium microadriaticum TaxID=2951 RepID=A0A1Q9BV81_SYMMI|nr:hypothetical protein AK812_SmicGene45938 [Symbiodinium microadriaticum]
MGFWVQFGLGGSAYKNKGVQVPVQGFGINVLWRLLNLGQVGDAGLRGPERITLFLNAGAFAMRAEFE